MHYSSFSAPEELKVLNTYGSVSPGQEFALILVLFLSWETYCDQTRRATFVFSTVSERSLYLHDQGKVQVSLTPQYYITIHQSIPFIHYTTLYCYIANTQCSVVYCIDVRVPSDPSKKIFQKQLKNQGLLFWFSHSKFPNFSKRRKSGQIPILRNLTHMLRVLVYQFEVIITKFMRGCGVFRIQHLSYKL